MKLTTKGRNAGTAMLDLALNQRGGGVTVADISQRQQISVAYLEQLFGRLRRFGLVESVRGPGGGYRLALPDSEIPLTLIVEVPPLRRSVRTLRCGLSRREAYRETATHAAQQPPLPAPHRVKHRIIP